MTVGAGETVTLPVTLVPVPRGSITDTAGIPIAGATVAVRGPVTGSVTGRYIVDRLIPGEYQVFVDAKRHRSAELTATVVPTRSPRCRSR